MKFEITILGSGSAVPTLSRYPTAHFVNIQEQFFLVDCGEGTQMQMKRFGVKMQRIKHIFISHLHGDHWLGLSGLLQTMHLLGRKQPIDVYGPPELESLIRSQFKAVHAQLAFEIIFHITQAKQKEVLFENKQVVISSFPLKHKVATTGFLFQEQPKPRTYLPKVGEVYNIPYYAIPAIKAGENYKKENGEIIPNTELTTDPEPSKSYAFCSDTAYYEFIIDHIQGVDLLYHEASFLEDRRDRAKATLHSTASDAAKIAQKARVKKLVLGHFSARYRNVEAFLEEAKPHFPATELGHDGMVVTL